MIPKNYFPCHITQATTFVNYNKAIFSTVQLHLSFLPFTFIMILSTLHCKSFLSTSPQSASNITHYNLMHPSCTPFKIHSFFMLQHKIFKKISVLTTFPIFSIFIEHHIKCHKINLFDFFKSINKQHSCKYHFSVT